MQVDKTIVLLRHPQVANFAEHVYNGSHDVGITSSGAKQFLKIGKFLAKSYRPDIIFSSDLIRAKAGAYFISRFSDAPVVFMKELRERNMGIFELKIWHKIASLYPNEAKQFISDPVHFRPAGGESFADQQKRVMKAFFTILSSEKKYIAIVAHGGTNRIILSFIKGVPLKDAIRIDQDYGCVNIIVCKKEQFSLIEENNTKIYENC